jgi:glycosyltransferase involved in cell wall biosynthesis
VHIAVVLPAYNLADYLADAIRSVLDQGFRDWSLTIVDDGSTDATADIAGWFKDPRLEMVRQANSGVSAARNTGLAAAMARAVRPDALLFLDGDDWLAPDALGLLGTTLEAAPWAAVAVGSFTRVRPGVPSQWRARRPPQGDLLERLVVQNRFANGGHLLIRRGAIEASGSFRTDLLYGEDWEYWVRIAMTGEFVAVRSPAPLLFVRERPDGAYVSRAADPQAYRPAMAAIRQIPGLAERIGPDRLAAMARKAEAEMAWTVGRELIRHGRRLDGLGWLASSLRGAPSARRLALLAVSWLGVGPFRQYSAVARTICKH